MNQRRQALVGQFFLAPVGNGDFGRALQRDVALVRTERMRRKSRNQSAAFDATDRDAPAILCKSIRHPRGERICRIAPEVLRMISAIDTLLVVESFARG